MDDTHFKLEAKENFLKMHHKSIFSDLFHIIRANEHNKLLSFYDVRSLLGDAKQEKYLGIQVIPVDKIIGSEGRYQDFTRSFLPKSKHLQERWVNIRTAAQKDINLPPIQLYKLGDAYFVRDGNHRVSVARSSGIEMIDAEVTQIISPIYVSADMTHKEILRRVIQYEKGIVFKQTRLANFIGTEDLTVTSPGSYSLIIQHIMGHKYFIEEYRRSHWRASPEWEELRMINPQLAPLDNATMSFGEAAQSWYESLFRPILRLIEKEGLLAQFPERTAADLYIWLISHWHYLKSLHGPDVPLEDALLRYRRNIAPWKRLLHFWGKRKAH